MITKPFVGVLLMACVGVASAAPVSCLKLESGWARFIPSNSMAAGYAVLSNRCRTPVTVIGARSETFAAVSVHETTVSSEGVSRMQRLDALVIPPHSRVELAPGGLHLMLMDARESVQRGAMVPVVLQLQGGAEVSGTLAVPL